MIVRKKRGSIGQINSRTTSRRSNKTTKVSKKDFLLNEIDAKLESIDKKYGPVVYEELQSRLEKTIDVFHEDIEKLFKKNFSSYKSDDKLNQNVNDEKYIKPKYISDYEKSKKD
jgi:hypothetical protein